MIASIADRHMSPPVLNIEAKSSCPSIDEDDDDTPDVIIGTYPRWGSAYERYSLNMEGPQWQKLSLQSYEVVERR